MTSINWFPGHMNKANRLLLKYLDKVDGIVEVVDARIPQSSRSPFIAQVSKTKPLLILLNKLDLADHSVVKKWISYFQKQGSMALAISSKNSEGLPRLRDKICSMRFSNRVSEQVRRLVIIGVPNSGKSTLINVLLRKKNAKTANIPGVTRDLVIYKLGSGIELIDSPGTLSPKFEDQMVAARLAALGSVKDGLYSAFSVLEMLYPYLQKHYGTVLCNRYGIEQQLPDIHEFISRVSFRLYNKKVLDSDDVVAVRVLKDLKDGRCGSLCLERPEDISSDSGLDCCNMDREELSLAGELPGVFV